ncbi:hypothetical protein POVCU2_0050350 [Plasmodium ovale curtisi]|uniref:Uncharacterized protein n=1 Tax=Plasmodium ovale curtisi TaxID=864141 RepID=A0A1A8W712_PLAOA|nr:hypothetical protein POVCU2_0050350 [Plasmodium ovale curtisi]SBS98515.1 hypothetical protein POVCU1_046710 [Plasmodium ovale curtisi]
MSNPFIGLLTPTPITQYLLQKTKNVFNHTYIHNVDGAHRPFNAALFNDTFFFSHPNDEYLLKKKKGNSLMYCVCEGDAGNKQLCFYWHTERKINRKREMCARKGGLVIHR